MLKTTRLHRTQIRLRPEVAKRIANLAYSYRMSMAGLIDEVFANLSDENVEKHIRARMR